MLSEEQLAARRAGVGGSDAAVVAGVSSYQTPAELWLEKIGLAPPDAEESEPAYWGQVLEALVADEFAKRRGVAVARVNKTLRCARWPFALANLDRRVVGLKAVLECKTINAWKGSKLEAPLDEHVLQVQHYLAVTGWSMAHIAYLVGGQRFVVFDVERDNELIGLLMDREAAFWSCVERQVMPDIDPDHPRTVALLKRLYPGTDGTVVALPPSLFGVHEELVKAKSEAAALERFVEACENRLRSAIGMASSGVFADGSMYQRKVVNRSSYTVEATSYVQMKFVKAKGEK
jgi:putative phage-type endonuclease